VLVVEGRQARATVRGVRFHTSIGGCYAVWARQEARLELDACDVTSGGSTGVVVDTRASLAMRRCRVHDCDGHGVVLQVPRSRGGDSGRTRIASL
jgi:hypothetical protein